MHATIDVLNACMHAIIRFCIINSAQQWADRHAFAQMAKHTSVSRVLRCSCFLRRDLLADSRLDSILQNQNCCGISSEG